MRVLLALPRLLRVSLSAGLTLGLSGCVRDQPYQLHAPAPPATLANLQDGTEISPKLPVTIPKDPREDKFAEPNVVTLEFSEKGRLFGDSCDPTQHGIEANCQLHRALKYIAEIESSTPATTRLVLLTYVHGNHHNASWSSSNFRDFQQLISCLNLGATKAKQTWTAISSTKDDFACGHMQPPLDVRYLGLYVGWRGEAIRPTAKLTDAAIISRFHAAQRIAVGPDLLPALRLVRREAAQGPNPPQTLLLGHSYGALLVSRITSQSMAEALGHTTGDAVCGTDFLRSAMLADFTIVINTADDALHMAELAAQWKTARAGCPSTSRLPAPAMLSVFTPTDFDTHRLFRVLQTVDRTDAAFPGRAFLATTLTQNSLDNPPPAFEAMRSNAFNTFDYFHNVCYLDQHRGGDDACVEVNKLILAAKNEAYRNVTGTDLQALVNARSVTPYYKTSTSIQMEHGSS
jgi:hypothetical protein